jgi:Mg2+ and Co2+ transporter CorA
MKLKEEIVDKFAGDLQHIQAEIEQMRRATFEEEDMIIKTLDNVRSKEDDRI